MPVGEADHRVLLVHDARDAPEPRRDDARQRRVAAEPDDDARPVAAHRSERARERDHGLDDDTDVREREAPLQPAARGAGRSRNPASGTTRPSGPRRPPTKRIDAGAWPTRDELLRERDRGVHVAAGAAAGEHRERAVAHRARGRAGPRRAVRRAIAGPRSPGCPRRPSRTRATSRRPRGTAA